MSNKIIHQQILEKVNRLAYSSTSNNELLSFATEACSSISDQEAIDLDKKSKYKALIIQIRDKQIRPLFNEELLVEEAKVMFTDAKESLALFLKDYIRTN